MRTTSDERKSYVGARSGRRLTTIDGVNIIVSVSRRTRMAACVAGFAAAIAVTALTGSLAFVHLAAMVVAYLSATVFVSYLVAGPDGDGARRR